LTNTGTIFSIVVSLTCAFCSLLGFWF